MLPWFGKTFCPVVFRNFCFGVCKSSGIDICRNICNVLQFFQKLLQWMFLLCCSCNVLPWHLWDTVCFRYVIWNYYLHSRYMPHEIKDLNFPAIMLFVWFLLSSLLRVQNGNRKGGLYSTNCVNDSDGLKLSRKFKAGLQNLKANP